MKEINPPDGGMESSKVTELVEGTGERETC